MAGKTIGGKNTPSKINSQTRQRRALELRLSGLNYVEIAEQAGYSGPGAAYKAVNTLLSRNVRQTADDVREIEVARLDRLLVAVWGKAIKGDEHAIDRVLSIMARRAKLLGLDAPAQIDIEVEIREEAHRQGVDPDEAVRAAAEIIREHRSHA